MSIEWARLVAETLFAWPVAAVLISIIFRRSIGEFLKDVKSAKFGPIELERRIDQIKRDTELIRELNRLALKASKVEGTHIGGDGGEPTSAYDVLSEIDRRLGSLDDKLEETTETLRKI
ncbi:MAG: hypothetical protein ACXIUV_03180 [Alkalilacustris sp.]